MIERGGYYSTYFNCKIAYMHLTNFGDASDLVIKHSLIGLLEFYNKILRLLANLPLIIYTAVLDTYLFSLAED